MDQIQAVPASLPHIVQVYPPSVTIHPSLQSQGKISYQQTITSESLHIPVSSHIHELQNQHLIAQNQTVMSCQQIHLQNVQPLQTQMQSQVLQGDMSQQLQITSHVILPQVPMFKQHLLTNNLQHQFYGQYETYLKDAQCVIAKAEPEAQLVTEKQSDCKTENELDRQPPEVVTSEAQSRNLTPNPSVWACNIRKQKHQRGEAYISRRGKFVPERRVKNIKDCQKSCRYKCNERINDVDRQHIFKAFYSLSANEKKHFLLNTTERNCVKQKKIMDGNHKRKYSFKYFFLVRAVRYTVCKQFYLGTLAISQKPVYNVHLGKSEMNLPKPDGRGLSETSAHALPIEVKDRVRKHIMSLPTVDSKPIKQYSRKKQYLNISLSMKQMYNMYVMDCNKDDARTVKESMYRRIFKQEFNLHYKKDKTGRQLCCKCKELMKKM